MTGYSLPHVGGPIMSNVHQPNSQMSVIGGVPGLMHPFGAPQHAGIPQMYGAHHAQQQPQNDRPFKCDQCPQSFNRNHDLKRHKRIHLAVKPFPCGHCDKSFSRKDALKRHILVKGCGKSSNSEGTEKQESPTSSSDKGDMSDGGDGD